MCAFFVFRIGMFFSFKKWVVWRRERNNYAFQYTATAEEDGGVSLTYYYILLQICRPTQKVRNSGSRSSGGRTMVKNNNNNFKKNHISVKGLPDFDTLAVMYIYTRLMSTKVNTIAYACAFFYYKRKVFFSNRFF